MSVETIYIETFGWVQLFQDIRSSIQLLVDREEKKEKRFKSDTKTKSFEGRHEETTFLETSCICICGSRLLKGVKGDRGPMKVQNANKLSIVFECDIMSQYYFLL